MTTSTSSPPPGAGSERAPAPQAPAGPSDGGRVERTPDGMDPALWAAVNAWDAERCRLNELWHGGRCAPCSVAHKVNTAPMLLPAIKAYNAAAFAPAQGPAAGVAPGYALVPVEPTAEMIEAITQSARVNGYGPRGAPLLWAEVLAAAPPPGPAPSGDALVAYLYRQWAWSKETFGPALRTKGVVQHIRKELVEIEVDPHDLAEWVDVIILAMDGFWRHGGKPEDLLPAMQAKQDKNFARTWPDWRTMGEDQAIEHDRSGEVAPSADTPSAGAGLAGVQRDGKIIHDLAQEYEHRDPDHTPTEAERAMLEDFGNVVAERLAALARDAHGGSAEAFDWHAPTEADREAYAVFARGGLVRWIFGSWHSLMLGGETRVRPLQWEVAEVAAVPGMLEAQDRARIEAEDRARPASGATGEG